MSKSLSSKPVPNQENIIDFVHRFNDLMVVRDSSDKLIEDILVYCQGLDRTTQKDKDLLAEELRKCQLYLADSVSNCRELEQQLASAKADRNSRYAYNESRASKTRNPYVVVLIDGDCLSFQDAWLRQGLEGGKKAADALHASIKRQWTDKNEDTAIIAKVAANYAALSRSGNGHEFRDFAIGFNQGNGSFDYVDVGSGRDCAESKIRGISSPKRQILLGISHKAGYASFLDELFRGDSTTRARISIIDSLSLAPEVKATGANTTRLDKELFCSEKRFDRTSGRTSAVGRTTSPTGSAVSSGANSSTISYANVTTHATPPPATSVPLAPYKPSPRSKTSQAVSSSSPSPKVPTALYQKIPPQQPNWNPGARGLDEPIVVNIATMEAVKKRKDTDKLCNNHFLRGPCAKGDGCNFVHDYKPNSEEINAIAVLARQNPCTHGQECENWECIYGHHCPSIRDGVCTHPFCKFDDDQHPPGTKFTLSKPSNR